MFDSHKRTGCFSYWAYRPSQALERHSACFYSFNLHSSFNSLTSEVLFYCYTTDVQPETRDANPLSQIQRPGRKSTRVQIQLSYAGPQVPALAAALLPLSWWHHWHWGVSAVTIVAGKNGAVGVSTSSVELALWNCAVCVQGRDSGDLEWAPWP